MSSPLDQDRVDKILRELKPNAMEYLRVFYLSGQGAQFQTCARQMASASRHSPAGCVT